MRIRSLAFVVALTATMVTAFWGASQPANAAIMYSSLSSWEAAAGTWAETTDTGHPNSSTLTSFTMGNGVTFTFPTLSVASIGSGWATWCCGYTGQVLPSYNTGSLTTESWTVSGATGAGMFIEPDPFSVLNITMTLGSGDTLTQAVNGDGGASFFGWNGPGITSFTISSSSDFAPGDFFSTTTSVSPTPEPSSLLLIGSMLPAAGLGSVIRRRRRPPIA